MLIFQLLQELIKYRKVGLKPDAASYHFYTDLQTNGSQSVLCGSHGIRDQFPGEPWIHFRTGYFQICLFFFN